MMVGSHNHYHKLRFFATLVIFMLALIPRLIHMGGFLTTDEWFWTESSRDFLGGLIDPGFTCSAETEHRGQLVVAANQGLACTLRSGHPGVITMWTGSLGIWLYYLAEGPNRPLIDFVKMLPLEPIDKAIIPWIRLPTAVLSAIAIAAIFLLLTCLLGRNSRQGFFVAMIATVMMALGPYQIAMSRILHTDALETIFSTLSLLMLFCYWGNEGSRRWLIASGIMAGLSLLAKSPALFLVPFTGLLGVWYVGKHMLLTRPSSSLQISSLLWRVTLDGLIWLAMALLAYGLFWPAIWVIPGSTFRHVTGVVFGYAATLIEEKGTFFWGNFVHDPGPFFYPVSWLFRTTPLVILGVILVLFYWLKGEKNVGMRSGLLRRLGYGRVANQGMEQLFFLSFLFILTFTLFLTLSSTKQDRYLLPGYPFLNIIAAIGWVWLAERTAPAVKSTAAKALVVITVSFATLNSLLVILSFPYYFTYFNPLLGGAKTAQQLIPVGWGEGLDVAANYLNSKPGANKLTVASWYGTSSFAPFFVGKALNYFQQKGNVLAADYAIVYIYQRQRNLPDSGLYNFLESYAPPEKVIDLAGVPYAWIYPSVGLDHHLVYDRYPDLAELLGWEYTTPSIDPDHPVLQPGSSLDFDLWWEYLGKSPDAPFFMWLVGPDHRIWAEATTQPKPEAGDPVSWSRGKIVVETGRLVVPPGMPPGDYTIYLGFYPVMPASPTTALLFSLNDTQRMVTVERGGHDASLPTQVELLQVEVGPLRLLGQHIDQTEMKPNEPFDMDLYWQASTDLTRQYQVSLALQDETGVERWAWERVDPVSFYPTQNWRQGDLIRSQLTARPTLRTPGGNYQLMLKVYEHEKLFKTVPLLPISIQGRVRQFTLPVGVTRVETLFEYGINLLAYQILEPAIFQRGAEVKLQLFWQTQADLTEDYTVFVQLLGPDGKIYGQMDAQPQQGAAPTSQWTPGEIIPDTYTLNVSTEAPPGEYQLITGIYLLQTNVRLKIEPSQEDFLRLTKVQIE